MTTEQKIAATRVTPAYLRDSGAAEPYDKLAEECGVFGIFGHPEAANLTFLGLYALQHRGRNVKSRRHHFGESAQ